MSHSGSFPLIQVKAKRKTLMRSVGDKRPGKEEPAKNFGLSKADFDELVTRLRGGDDQLFRQVFLSHFDDCMAYLKRHVGASHEDAYDMTMETMLIFCKQLKAGRLNYGNLRFLFTKMATQQYQKWKQKGQHYLSVDELQIALEDDPSPAMKRAFEQAWSSLGEPCRQLISQFYYDKMSLRKLAELLSKSETATRKRKQRCMQSLQEMCQSIYQA